MSFSLVCCLGPAVLSASGARTGWLVGLGRGTKRKAHTALLRELATEWGGTAGFNPLLCGRGRSLKQCAREPWETNNALL